MGGVLKPLGPPARLALDGVEPPKDRRGSDTKPKGMYLMDETTFDVVYGPEEQAFLAKMLQIDPVPKGPTTVLAQIPDLQNVEIIMASWKAPLMDEAFLEAAPRLRAVFYAAGSIRYFTTDAFWRRGIVVSSAYVANAVPVAEYTLGAILLSLKRFWSFASSVKDGTDPWNNHVRPVAGAYHSTVGIVSFGMVARRVVQLLKSFDVRCIVYCPFLTAEEANAMGVERCSLADVFAQSNVVSVHTPLLPETQGLVTGRLIASMKKDATLINTARGGVIREGEMIEVLSRRPDLWAVLDVCDPEPPVAGSALLRLPNVVVTPHISGSLGSECRRLGQCMVEELSRYLLGKPLQWQITADLAAKLA